jgi:rubrerythrin
VGSTYDLFKRAERVEQLAAEIYATLAAQFRDDAATRALFQRLAAEEEQHAARVRLLAGTYRSEPRLRVNGVEVLDACVASGEAVLAAIRAGEWGDDVADIKRRLSELEARCAHAHAEILAANGGSALADFFRQLAEQDDAHVELLAS